jgi:hypothetical protein
MKVDERQIYNVFLRPQEALKSAQTTTSTESASAGSDFASILSQAQKTATPALEELTLGLLPKFDSIGQIQASQAINANKTESPYGAADDIESLLSLLDNYVEALGDQKNTLKDLAPLADDLENAASELGQASLKMSSDDPLKALSSDAASIAMVESLKFKRGDYI